MDFTLSSTSSLNIIHTCSPPFPDRLESRIGDSSRYVLESKMRKDEDKEDILEAKTKE